MQVSLVVEVYSDDELCEDTIKELTQFISQAIFQQRIAGGSVMAMAKTNPVQYFGFEKLCNIAPMLMPAFVLMDASDEFADLIAKSQDKDPSTTPLDVFWMFVHFIIFLRLMKIMALNGIPNQLKQVMAGLCQCLWVIRQSVNSLIQVKWQMFAIQNIAVNMWKPFMVWVNGCIHII